jgi:hypothetical protein
MNASRNQLASTGRQRIAMQIDAKPENEVFQVRHFQPDGVSVRSAPAEAAPFPIHFNLGYSDLSGTALCRRFMQCANNCHA